MGTYWTKCGKQFEKATEAATTGYKLPDTWDQMGKQCVTCPYRKEILKGWPHLHDHWECRAGSQEQNHATEYRGSVEDVKSLYIMSMNHDLLELIREWCEDHSDLSAQYNQDLPDCREQLAVRCSKNNTGKKAKAHLLKDFNQAGFHLIKVCEPVEARPVSYAGMKFSQVKDESLV